MDITFEDLQRANGAMKSTDIGKGKEYMEVNQRIKAFRMVYPTGAIATDLISNENGVCIFHASVLDDGGRLLGTGTAYEKEGSSFINKTSYIENCETSAVGRALAMCGFGIDLSIASYEEVANAKEQQKAQEPTDDARKCAELRSRILKYVNSNSDKDAVLDYIKKSYKCAPNEMQTAQCEHFIKTLQANGKEV